MFFYPLSHRGFSPLLLFFLHWMNCFSLVMGCFLKIYLPTSNQISIWKQVLFSLLSAIYKVSSSSVTVKIMFPLLFYPQLYKNGSHDAFTPRLESSSIYKSKKKTKKKHVPLQKVTILSRGMS